VAAIYARKSTEQVGVTDEQRSVTRQTEHARAYALAHGWVVRDEYIFVDDGISGAEFRKRPGLTRLLNTLRPRPPFQVLLMSEESRLGREQIETAYVIKQILDAGVRLSTTSMIGSARSTRPPRRSFSRSPASPPRWSESGRSSGRTMRCYVWRKAATSPAARSTATTTSGQARRERTARHTGRQRGG